MADTTITIPAGSALDEELERISEKTGHAKVDVALVVLTDWLEEQAEIREIRQRLESNEPASPLDEVWRRLGLDD